MFAVLVGGNEVNGGMANAGDTDAFGTISILVHPTPSTANDQLCFGLSVRGITGIDFPTAAHIHAGKAGVNGAIVVTLMPPTGGDPGTSSGCVNAPQSVVNQLIGKPSNFYVNVHSTAFPGGALRGQLF